MQGSMEKRIGVWIGGAGLERRRVWNSRKQRWFKVGGTLVCKSAAVKVPNKEKGVSGQYHS
jgi:hypothetical protein